MPAILLVDDRPENLVALQAILEPLGEELVPAGSGEEALRILLRRDDFAVILLDVQMPMIDGFETAETIKQRERTRNIPIIFMTAISKEEAHVFHGYEVGAVDYVFKPLNADILRNKVAVFVELHEKNEELHRQRELLALQELVEVRREGAERYRQLADAMPQIVWTSNPAGQTTYCNRRWFEYTGAGSGDRRLAWADFVHPDDLPAALALREETLASGAVFEVEYRFRASDGSYRWHLGRAVPIRNDAGEIEFWIGTATDIDARKRIEDAQRFLIDAGAALSSSLDYHETLQMLARLAVPRVADWCTVHLVEDGEIVEVALEHVDPGKAVFAQEIEERYPPRPSDERGISKVIASGTLEFLPEIADELLAEAALDETHLELIGELGLRSWICVPLVSRGRTIGAISLVAAESGRTFDALDVQTAEELAQRAATAIDNARLYEQVEQRARAALALQTIADGVALLDVDGRVLLWNDAAETITGVVRDDVAGRRLEESLPLSSSATAANVPKDGSRADAVPVEVGGRELWLSVSRVDFAEGTVYTFRDVTEERKLEQMRSEMVATVSHELRTPLAAIFGAAVTLQEREEGLDGTVRANLLGVIAEESERLARIIGVVLLASHLDSGQLELKIETVDAVTLTEGVVDSARAHLPDHVTLELDAAGGLPLVVADEQQLRQVLVNLVENAVKYSPDGGRISVSLTREDRYVQWAVCDAGLGIPPSERRRVFEKFYRLDPNMARGIGGTGLGLYICRELVHRLDGRIWVEANEDKGSTFYMRIPAAARVAKPRQPRARQAA